MKKLEGKVAIITGGARGQGAAHVQNFVQEGAKVVFTDILVDEGKALEEEIGENVKFIEHDISNEEAWKKVAEETVKAFGKIDILVNNAAFGKRVPLEETTTELYRRIFEVNQLGTLVGMQTVLPYMKENKKGSIVNIASIEAMQIAADTPIAYAASKFAIFGMTKSAAIELAKYNIRVNAVHPGSVNSAMLEASDPVEKQKLLDAIPLGRAAEPEEISKLVIYLASDDASYSTGGGYLADGGITALL